MTTAQKQAKLEEPIPQEPDSIPEGQE